ncbi:UNVERIFIED_CONTAM: AT-hook motif nuclear-localized protein 10 [Sesamum calycinum]|uniref:AT-hook motif nuclear-localized protein n=1 Tax=Sesamum calycinum TaxID=2727403 RepID=A0AAW2QLF7_9LAMI
MSGVPEAAAVMTSRDLFTVGPSVSTGPASSQSQLDQQMRVPYTADGAYRPVGSPQPYQSISGGGPVMKHGMNLNSGDQKRKRGRPRKFNWNWIYTSCYHVNAGEDVSSKIMAFSQNGPRAVCILSANGAVSNVTLRQAATSGGTATYEGRFDILSLSGSFMLSEVGGQKSRTGGLSTTLAGPDGRVFGGCVAGLLVAASPVQRNGRPTNSTRWYNASRADKVAAVYAPNHSFLFLEYIFGLFYYLSDYTPSDSWKLYSRWSQGTKIGELHGALSAPPKVNLGSATGASSSPSRGTFSESSGGPASPLNLSSGACNNHPPGMSGMPWK